MILGLHIEVLFANFGFLANPQPKVINVFFSLEFLFVGGYYFLLCSIWFLLG